MDSNDIFGFPSNLNDQDWSYENDNWNNEDIYNSYFEENTIENLIEEVIPNSIINNSSNNTSNLQIQPLIQQNFINKPKKTRSKPTNLKPTMTSIQLKFMEDYYLHFKGSKTQRVRKELVKFYHKLVVNRLQMKGEKIRDTNRDEQRNGTLYFIHFAPNASLIMETIYELEEENIINYERDSLKYSKNPPTNENSL